MFFSSFSSSTVVCSDRCFFSSSAIIARFSLMPPIYAPTEVSRRTESADMLCSGLSKPM